MWSSETSLTGVRGGRQAFGDGAYLAGQGGESARGGEGHRPVRPLLFLSSSAARRSAARPPAPEEKRSPTAQPTHAPSRP
jgi:hypothetical protein